MSAKTVSTALLILVTLLFFNVAEARTSESALPGGCLASGFKHGGGEVVLNPDSEKQGLFLLHNISSETFQVTHPVGGGTASAGWTSEIGPGRWSAFATDSKAFTLSCMKPVDGGVKTLPCEDVLKVCELPNPKMPADLSGSFWVSEDKNAEGVTAEIKSRGVSWGK
jgi:hypothetical protein